MILSWISSKEVIGRILRNTKGVQAEYMDDILEWIPEALLKMKTVYSVESRSYKIELLNHQAKLPCRIEGLLCVSHHGQRLNYYDKGRIEHHPESAGFSVFKSTLPIYTSSGDIADENVAASRFPRDFVEVLKSECHPDAWYKVNGKFLESSIKCGELTVWVQEIPKDEEGNPLVPDNEYYGEAIYRYCRMMLIEAGYEDKIISHRDAVAMWTDAAGKAISDTCFPTPDQVESSIHRHLDNFFPDGSEFNNSW